MGEGLMERLCAAGIVRRVGIDRVAVKEIAVYRRLIKVSVAVLFLSFLVRAIMFVRAASPLLANALRHIMFMYVCIAAGNISGQSPDCGICGSCQTTAW